MSGEHLYADWISRLFSRYARKPRYQIRAWDNTGRNIIREATSMDEKLKVVCEPCNNQWMSDLEARASVVLPPLILGQGRITIADEDHVLVNAWIMKTAMVLDAARTRRHPTKPPFFSPAQRATFRNTLEMPDYTHIWLVRFKGNPRLSGRSITAYNRFPRKPFGNQRAFILTFTVRQLTLQVLVQRRVEGRRGPIAPPEARPSLPWDDILLQMWPFIGNITWPGRFHLDDDGLKLFVNRWGMTDLLGRTR